MEGSGPKGDVWKELKSYKRKYYLSQLVRGTVLLLAIVVTLFLLINTLEFSFRFGKAIRAILFFIFLLSFTGTFIYFVLDPLLKLMGRRPGLTDEEAAKMIGGSFPTIKDRLVNLIQLRKISESGSLVDAGISQKSEQVGDVSFKSSIKLGENKKYLKYVLSPVSLAVVVLIAYPSFFTDSTERIVKFNREFVPEAPFTFNPEMEEYGFKNEDYIVDLELAGSAFPENTYIISNGRKIKMAPIGNGRFQHIFKKLQYDRDFRFEAAGFFSSSYEIQVVERPSLKNFNVILDYPRYTGKSNERLSNIGNIQIPEGTNVQWQFSTNETESLAALFLNDSISKIAEEEGGVFEIDNRFLESDNYVLTLSNEFSNNKEILRYGVDVIKDEFPQINLTLYQDTVLYSMVALGGNLSDDYGLTGLKLHYVISDEKGKETGVQTKDIALGSNQANQGFYYQWMIDSLGLEPGQNLSYYLEVWDNDGINGRKSSKTGRYQFKVPGRREIKEKLDESQNKTEEQIEESLQSAEELQRKLKEAEEKMKGKRRLDWEDEKLLKDVLEKKDEVEEAIEELKKMNKNSSQQRDRFSPQNESFQEKSRQLQKLMDEMMDPETKQLYDELQKLLDEQAGVEQIQEMMEQLSRRQRNIKNELERSLEMFKRLKLEQKINEAVGELDDLAKEESKLADETADDKTDPKELLEKQEELAERFDELQNDLDDANDLNQELDMPQAMPNQTDLNKDIQKNLDESIESLEKLNEEASQSKEGENNESQEGENSESQEGENSESQEGENSESQEGENSESQEGENSESQEGENSESQEGENSESQEGENSESQEGENSESQQGENSEPQEGQQQQSQPQQSRQDAQDSQRDAARKMQKMAQELQQMQSGMQMQMMQMNIDNLRDIIDNLLKLSFDQENLMKNFRDVKESDPGFVPLSQEQLKLSDDSRVIEDSLLSLATRADMIGSFITREISDMNEHMDKSMEALKERKKYKAVSEQQFAMTSMNNLALLLDDALDNMMNMMMSQGSGKGKKQQQQQQQSLGEMQQLLNEQIRQLKESGKTGRELSEELAKLAAEQARIRKALQEMQRRMEEMSTDGENGSKPGGNLDRKMEETELDLVNKRLTELMIRRQQDILTRLLEAENAMRERELDEDRKGETATEYDKIIPRSFDEYLKQKEREIEMLKTLPPKLFPYYKREVSDYFKRIGEGQK